MQVKFQLDALQFNSSLSSRAAVPQIFFERKHEIVSLVCLITTLELLIRKQLQQEKEICARKSQPSSSLTYLLASWLAGWLVSREWMNEWQRSERVVRLQDGWMSTRKHFFNWMIKSIKNNWFQSSSHEKKEFAWWTNERTNEGTQTAIQRTS